RAVDLPGAGGPGPRARRVVDLQPAGDGMRRLLVRAAVVAALTALVAVAIALFTRGHDTVSVGSVELLRPRSLYILCALPLVGAALWASLVDLGRAQQRLSALLRMLLVGCLALALARPSTVSERRTVATVLLV